MTHNEIIKELLCRLAAFNIGLNMTEREYLSLKGTPLSEKLYTQRVQNMEKCVASPDFLGGEAKALWDMVNESPYTPLETELLQRLDIVHYVHRKAGAGDFVENWLAMALHAPTETVKGFKAVLPYAESGLPWSETWIWEQYKDSF